MASIKYAHILNSFVSTEGSAGIMTNYFYYSMLLVYEDGSRQLVEGQASQLQQFMRYVRTPQDELQELKETVKGLRADINEIVDERMTSIMDTFLPIPDITGENEVTAINALKEAGLLINKIFDYPQGTPNNGIVRSYKRRSDNYKTVDLEIIHEIPDIKGLSLEEALRRLHEIGMTESSIKFNVVSEGENGTVLNYYRLQDDSLEIILEVASYIPDTKGMLKDEAIELLGKNGFVCSSINTKPDNGTPNTVLNWTKINDHEVSLVISMPAKVDCKKVVIRANTLSDSSGDHYSATATYSNAFKELKIILNAEIGSKSKHKISSVKGTIGSAPADFNFVSLYLLPALESGSKQELPIIAKYDDQDHLPSEINLVIETQYGIVKKSENIILDLSLTW